jgi:hypothetical protein
MTAGIARNVPPVSQGFFLPTGLAADVILGLIARQIKPSQRLIL